MRQYWKLSPPCHCPKLFSCSDVFVYSSSQWYSFAATPFSCQRLLVREERSTWPLHCVKCWYGRQMLTYPEMPFPEPLCSTDTEALFWKAPRMLLPIKHITCSYCSFFLPESFYALEMSRRQSIDWRWLGSSCVVYPGISVLACACVCVWMIFQFLVSYAL